MGAPHPNDTTTNPKQSSLFQYPVLTTTLFLRHKTQFEFLERKGCKIKLNVMNNQCTKQIKKFLTENNCELMLVELHNHRVNVGESKIQTFKDHFISAPAMTDSESPLQLWDKLTSLVKNTLNPNISAYETIRGPYDWNHFPLAPPGCKAVIYKSPDTRGSWGSQSTDAWYLGPLVDHYQCNHYFVPKTRAYRISCSAELFPSIARSHSCQQKILCMN
jgi:hypothetical protein